MPPHPDAPDPPAPQPKIPTNCIVANAIATALSLLILAAILYGVASQIPPWESIHESPTAYRAFRIGLAGVELEFYARKPHPSFGGQSPITDGPKGFEFLGLTLTHETLEWTNAAIRRRNTILGFPWWPLYIWVFARPLFRALCATDIARLQRQPRSTTHCNVCGYDLRATPDRCPECGTILHANRHG